MNTSKQALESVFSFFVNNPAGRGNVFGFFNSSLRVHSCLQIIVATPGRLLDHIENKSGFSVRLMGLKMLILDEADHLLDLGYRKDIEKIVDSVPRQRQSLLFSATFPREVLLYFFATILKYLGSHLLLQHLFF